ncbi:MAG: polysaccharide deacetylase family protein [Minisyncoccia bacterium]
MRIANVIKNIYFSVAIFISKELGEGASILMYHSVDANNAFFSVTKEAFEKQMEYLVSRKVTILKLSELVRRMQSGESIVGCVCITFDDGYKDNYINAFPILKKYNIPATIFLTTGSIGGSLVLKSGISLPILSLVEIMEMRDSGLVEFSPHSVTHIKYNQDNFEKCTNEAIASKEQLEQLLGEPSTVYAYPSGRFDAHFVEVIKNEGYTAAVTVKEGIVYGGDDLFALKRNPVDSLTGMTQFKGKISRGVELYIWTKNIFK